MIYPYCKACKKRESACLLPANHRAQGKVVWCADFLLGGKKGKRVRKVFKAGVSKKDVEKYEHLLIADFERGVFLPQDKGKTLFEVVLDKYLNEHIIPNTRSTTSQYNIKEIKKLLGNYAIGLITLEQLQKTREKFKEDSGDSNAGVNRMFSTLKTALRRAVEWGYIQRSPAEFLRDLPVKETIPRFLTIEEIHRLRSQIKDERLSQYVLVLLHTGIRPIDIEALSWADVDLNNRIIHVTTHKGRKPHRYSVPIDDELMRVLQRRFKDTNGQGVVFDTSNLRKLAEKAISDSGINKDRKPEERFTIYGLKHCYASHLLMNGATIFDVAKLLGHTDTKMVMKHYGFLTMEHLRKTQGLINLTKQTPLEVIK